MKKRARFDTRDLPVSSEYDGSNVEILKLLLATEKDMVVRQPFQTGTVVGPDEIRKICQILRIAVEYGHEAKERLSGNVAKEFAS